VFDEVFGGKYMAFLLRRSVIIIIVAAIAVLVLVSFSGILSTEPLGLFIASAEFTGSNSIRVGENTTLTVVLKNWADQPKTFELHIIFSGNLSFYDGITKEGLLDISQHDIYYNLTYPTRGTLDMQGSTSIPIVTEGREPIGGSQTYTLFVEVFFLEGLDRKFADQTTIQLTVTRS
jgi:hypothetical protein